MKVLFGGAFDLLHYGHIKAIEKAQELGDHLIIHVMSDRMVKKKKGNQRPIIPEAERIAMIMALKWVNDVVCYPDLDVVDLGLLLDHVKPDVFVFNGENLHNEVEECNKRGIKIVQLDRIIAPSGLDTTKIIQTIGDTNVARRELHLDTGSENSAPASQP